jgi:iron complex outermembrane recepter protein
MYLRLPPLAFLGILPLVFAGFAQQAIAQSAAPPTPAPAAEPLPPLEVTTGQPKKKTAKSKSKSKAAAPVVQAGDSPPVATGADSAGGAGEGATKPGLNLEVPSTTGSRLGLTPLETPASIEIIPGTTIRERGQNSVTDAVTQNATGFTSTGSPGNGWNQYSSRGFGGNNSVMQLYDGTRLYVGLGVVAFPFDTWSAERIEVLHGPASVLYGEGSVGGVINVVPKRPTDYFTAEGEVAYGTDNTRRFGVGAGGPVSDQLGYRIDVSGLQSDGWLDQEGDFDKLAISGAVTYKPTSDLKFTLSNDYGNQSPLRYLGTPLINGDPKPLRFTNFNVRDSELNFRDNWTQLKTEWAPSEWFSVRNVAYRLTSKRHWKEAEVYEYNNATGMVDIGDFLEIYNDQEQLGNRFDATLRANLGGGMKNETVLGFDVNRVTFLNSNNYNGVGGGVQFNTIPVVPFNYVPLSFFNVIGTSPSFETTTNQYSLFAENRLTLTPELTIVGGIRFDHPDIERERLSNNTAAASQRSFEKSFSATTWRVGAVYSPIRDLAFYGQYATAADPSSGDFGIITLNAPTSPYVLTTARQYEVGVKQSFWDGRGEWTIAAYDIEKQNLISADPNRPLVPLQVGAQSARGVEGAVALQLTDTLRYEGNVALLQARFDQFVAGSTSYAGNRPPNIPEQVVNNWLSWAFLPQWEAHLGVRWVGNMYGDFANAAKRPAYTLVNMGLDYEVTEKSEIALRVYNVFDEVYSTYGGSTQWQLAPPRTGEVVYRMKY